MKRGVAASGVVFGTVLLLLLIAAWTGPTLATQSRELKTKLPEAVATLERWMAARQPALLDLVAPPDTGVAAAVDAAEAASSAAAPEGGRLIGAMADHAPAVSKLAFGVLQSTIAVLGASVLVVFLAVYIAADPDTYRQGLLLMIPHERRDRFGELLTALGGALRTWFATQLIAMGVIGVVTTIILAVIGVPAALPLGVLAGLFEFIPNVGPTLSAIPAILMGLTDSPRMALVVVGVYWLIQFLENNLLIPYLMKEQLDLPPALTLVTQVVMAYVFGFLGLFVAIPLLATVFVGVRMFWVEDDLPPLPTVEWPAARRTQMLAMMSALPDLEEPDQK
ncbi:MAG: AI-2E family transporter [Gemmatimonadetes bacterium]|nr:AI-2E family transporter [Gemmatimonadota bacterium]